MIVTIYRFDLVVCIVINYFVKQFWTCCKAQNVYFIDDTL